jgi:hypothetical protein
MRNAKNPVTNAEMMNAAPQIFIIRLDGLVVFWFCFLSAVFLFILNSFGDYPRITRLDYIMLGGERLPVMPIKYCGKITL